MVAKALTVRAIETLKPGPARREVPDGNVPGLYLIVQPSGKKSWAIRYRNADGRTRKLTLDNYPVMDIGKAREQARKALSQARDGENPRDPAEEKVTAKRAPKVAPAPPDLIETVVDVFVKRYADKNTRASSAREYRRVLDREVVSRWPGRRLSTITRAEIHDMLDAHADRGAAVQANRTLAAFRKLCNWAVDRGMIATSPCAGVKPPTAESGRTRVLNEDEMRAIWRVADKLGYPFGPIVKLLMLTGQRKSEVGDLVWPEIDIGSALWTLPAARAKNGIEHEIPLSQQALDVLATLPRLGASNGFAFTTTVRTPVSGYGRFKEQIDRAIAADVGESLPHWTFHDLRRTCATGLARLGIALPVIERTLNHVSGSFAGIVGTYQKHSYSDEKRAALTAWGAFIERLMSEPGANVVEIRKAG
jgi:integrase